jgi:hypothetical protein
MAMPGATIGDWPEARFERALQRMVYRDRAHQLLTRDTDGFPIFTPQTRQDHAAVEFVALEPAPEGRVLEVVMEGGPQGDAYCPAILQDQNYDRLTTIWWRGGGTSRRAIAVSPDVTRVRVVFQSQRLRPARLPKRVQLLDHR